LIVFAIGLYATFFSGPPLVYVWCVRHRAQIALLTLGLPMLLLGLGTAQFGSEGIGPLLYVPLGLLALLRGLWDLPAADYGLRRSPLRGLLAGLLGGAVMALAYTLFRHQVIGLTTGNGEPGGRVLLLGIAGSFLGPALWEELLFRGIFLGELERAIARPRLALFAIAGYFALAHSNRVLEVYRQVPLLGLGYLMFLLVGGVVMGRLKQRYGLLPAILFHGTFNVLN